MDQLAPPRRCEHVDLAQGPQDQGCHVVRAWLRIVAAGGVGTRRVDEVGGGNAAPFVRRLECLPFR